MKQFNIEIFDENFNFLFNTSADKTKYKEDYLDPEKAKVVITTDARIAVNSIIRLYRDDEDYAGIITDVKVKDDGTTEVTYSSVESLFDKELLIDVGQIQGTMEQYMKALMDELYVINSDTSQRLPMQITAVTSTNDWSFDYKIENEPDEDEEPPERLVAFVNILDDLIIPGFTQYGIILDWTFDFNNKLINVYITKNLADPITIEPELPNIIDDNITIRKAKKRINKVNIWNSQDYERSIVYYLHSDDSFDTTDSDRVTPVNYKNLKVSADNNEKCISKKVSELKSEYSKIKSYNSMDPAERTEEDIEEAQYNMTDINYFMSFGWTYNSSDNLIYDSDNIVVGQESWTDEDEFEAAIEAWADTAAAETYGEVTALSIFLEKAHDKAYQTFSKNKYDNLIELEVAEDDDMIKPMQLKVGQIVNIISEGVSYTSILSGREIDTTVTLIFGTIRLELTKTLKGRA